ncbi:unnamed protein product [Brugia pahangi]|uniref:Uncharacterized protein n=1 Tax=Brugia pahangi TaxID=6280 RepID=A0A0N4TJ97_BRUPA|nr:unnamed protein product [Brugia pahangi]
MFILLLIDNTIKRSSSVSGILVMCYDDEETCMKECFFTCHSTDHCNDSLSPKVACFPHLILMTFAFILFVVCCCCCICIVGPVLLCYKSLQKWQRKRRNRRLFV